MKNKKIILPIAGALLIALIIGAVVLNLNRETNTTSTTGIGDVDFSTLANQEIVLNDETITLTTAGSYYITGSIADGSIIINTDQNIQLVLDSVSINNNSNAAIIVESAKNISIELVGDNIISANPSDDYNGAIWSKNDLLFSGNGSLTLTSTRDGIVTKDDLQIDGGTYVITSSDDGIIGRDSIQINDGIITINAEDDGLKTTNEEKGAAEINGGVITITSGDDSINSVNTLTMNGGELTITSGDDGIHADHDVVINDGKITVTKSYEGIEGENITVNGGEISIIASDDGFNAAGGDGSTYDRPGANRTYSTTNSNIQINGGNIYINASGDGIDSNGNIYITGGTTYVDGPTSDGNGPIDYGDGGAYVFEITGGTLIAVGSSGMAVSPTSGTTVSSILMNLSTSYSGNLSFGNISYSPAKTYRSVLIASTDLSIGEPYTLTINNQTVGTYTLSSTVTTSGSGAMNGMQGGSMQGGGMQGGRRQ